MSFVLSHIFPTFRKYIPPATRRAVIIIVTIYFFITVVYAIYHSVPCEFSGFQKSPNGDEFHSEIFLENQESYIGGNAGN